MARKSSQLALFAGVALLMVALAGCGAAGAPSAGAPSAGAPSAGASADGSQSSRINVEIHAFEVEPDLATVKAGPVTFFVTNTDVQKHEMLVVPFPDAPSSESGVKAALQPGRDGPLEQVMSRMVYDTSVLRLNEDDLGSLGEVADIEGGTSGEVTLDLAPGTYLLLCNLPVHFQAGMWTKLTVTR